MCLHRPTRYRVSVHILASFCCLVSVGFGGAVGLNEGVWWECLGCARGVGVGMWVVCGSGRGYHSSRRARIYRVIDSVIACD